jgi:hypothetical protein
MPFRSSDLFLRLRLSLRGRASDFFALLPEGQAPSARQAAEPQLIHWE